MLHSPASSPPRPGFVDFSDDEDAETASQRSIPLSSPSTPPDHEHRTQEPVALVESSSPPPPNSTPSLQKSLKLLPEFETSSLGDTISEIDVEGVSFSSSSSQADTRRSSLSAAAPAVLEPKSEIRYPPTRFNLDNDAASMTSFSSSSSRKARPESLLVEAPQGPLVLGIGLVDFNHLVSHSPYSGTCLHYPLCKTREIQRHSAFHAFWRCASRIHVLCTKIKHQASLVSAR